MNNIISKLAELNLWVITGIKIEEVIERISERSDETCELATDIIVQISTNPDAIKAIQLLPMAISLWGPSTKTILEKTGLPQMEMLAELVALHVEFLVRQYLKELENVP